MMIYIGDGFIPGIPARDLTADDVLALGDEWDVEFLLACGLYAVAEPDDPEDGE